MFMTHWVICVLNVADLLRGYICMWCVCKREKAKVEYLTTSTSHFCKLGVAMVA